MFRKHASIDYDKCWSISNSMYIYLTDYLTVGTSKYFYLLTYKFTEEGKGKIFFISSSFTY